MKITLDQSEIFAFIKTGLEARGFGVPEEAEGLFELLQDADGLLLVEVPVEFGRGAPTSRDSPVTPPVRAESSVDPRTTPIPSPRSSDEDPEPSGLIKEEIKKENVRLTRAGPRQYVPARDKYKKSLIAAQIEDFGKDPSDISDEI